MTIQVQKGSMSGALTDIYSFYKADPVFSNILSYFAATANDIEEIMYG